MSDDPWISIDSNVHDGSINGRRVDATLPWGLFWALGAGQRCLLVLRHQADAQSKAHVPKLKGLEIAFTEPDKHGTCILLLKLLDSTQRDIFHRLCSDIVNAASRGKTETEAVSLFLARTWRWHHLLRGGLDQKLSREEQKGLIGELIVIERLLLPNLSSRDAVAAWKGPLGAPKDFEIGRLCIEAKARRGAATPFVAISSEHQLDTSGVDALYLHVVELDGANEGANCAFTVTDIADRVRDHIVKDDVDSAYLFEKLLMASGFRWEDDYKDNRWLEGSSSLFEVRDAFPRITSAACSSGVTNVKYSIALKDCLAYRVTIDAVTNLFKEVKRGNTAG
ncbi:MAG: PD-(D/E)XK motif protein [Polaromonas sp.]